VPGASNPGTPPRPKGFEEGVAASKQFAGPKPGTLPPPDADVLPFVEPDEDQLAVCGPNPGTPPLPETELSFVTDEVDEYSVTRGAPNPGIPPLSEVDTFLPLVPNKGDEIPALFWGPKPGTLPLPDVDVLPFVVPKEEDDENHVPLDVPNPGTPPLLEVDLLPSFVPPLPEVSEGGDEIAAPFGGPKPGTLPLPNVDLLSSGTPEEDDETQALLDGPVLKPDVVPFATEEDTIPQVTLDGPNPGTPPLEEIGAALLFSSKKGDESLFTSLDRNPEMPQLLLTEASQLFLPVGRDDSPLPWTVPNPGTTPLVNFDTLRFFVFEETKAPTVLFPPRT